MLCKIADLITEVPGQDGMSQRCEKYLYNGSDGADITIRTDLYRREKYPPQIAKETVAYMESGYQFYKHLLRFDGMYLHASAVVRDGKAYLFSGHCGAGKSTHTQLWVDTFGDGTYILNDDKPALRRIDGVWYAYGTPWCGKSGINRNEKAPLAGICFVKQAKENRIRSLGIPEAMQKLMAQTLHKLDDVQQLDTMLRHLERLLQEVPVYELENLPQAEAARLSYETMSAGTWQEE